MFLHVIIETICSGRDNRGIDFEKLFWVLDVILKNKKDSNARFKSFYHMQQACLSAISDKSLFELTL